MKTLFLPKDGAPIDMAGLQSIANTPKDVAEAYLSLRWGESSTGCILEGLEPNGKRPKKNGPPGVMQFSVQNFVLSAGVAIVPVQGSPRVFQFEDSQVIQLEEPEKSKNKRSIVLSATAQVGLKATNVCANERITPMVMVVDQGSVDDQNMLVIANELAPNIWSTDVARMVTCQHPLIHSIMSLLDDLEDAAWESDQHGQPWQVQRLGREWKTYQSKASVAITGARMTLSMRPSTTLERVRVLTNLHWQLQRSVEQAAQKLSNWMGVLEAADQYAVVFSAPPTDWDEM